MASAVPRTPIPQVLVPKVLEATELRARIRIRDNARMYAALRAGWFAPRLLISRSHRIAEIRENDVKSAT